MGDFDYGNARLRAMKSRLLSRRALEALAEARSVDGLIAALTETDYRVAVEAALVRLSGMECLSEALRNHLVATVGKAGRLFTGSAGELASLALGRYDLHNVKAVLRGLVRQSPANEILAAALPIGTLSTTDLAELARAPNASAAIDLLATWRVPLARPLLELRASPHAALRRGPGLGVGPDLFEMELALDRWYLRTALHAARRAEEAGRALYEALKLEADVADILIVLRLAGAAEAESLLRQRFGSDDVAPLLVGPGNIPQTVLSSSARRNSVPAAVEALSSTPYHALLAGVIDARNGDARLSLFERALRRRQLDHAAACLAADALGIGVLVGYLALKTNEVSNVRAIAQGIALGEKADRIRSELMFAG
jgi:V/A-type H+-transporting ATPase subunit C